ncbi:16S rRNA (cytosine(1402)-N(4))-methyltransferase RsmH [Candidatus Nitrospira bockiana]
MHEKDNEYEHIPVLVEEVLAGLKCRPSGTYLDCTVGQGGLLLQILHAVGPDGFAIGLDRDEEALAAAKVRLEEFARQVRLIQGSFADLKRHLQAAGVARVDGVVFDLGVSSAQLNDPVRGFSFMVDGPLDMRMDRRQPGTAADLLNTLSETELADLIYRYGEERYARRIARSIVRTRAHRPLTRTFDLVDAIREAVPPVYRRGRIHFATRTFQALRIAVNREIEILQHAFRDAIESLVPGGRLCIISFHSLEDRVAKQCLRAWSQGDEARVRLVTKKPIVASASERAANPRSRSAKLRIAERLPLGRCA